jgi:hypothetical protein
MALLTTQNLISSAGVVIAPVAAAGGGDTFQNTGKELLYVKNGSGSSINVTIAAQSACSFGVTNAVHDLVVAVGAGVEKYIGPFDVARHTNPSTGLASIAYSLATSVTVACTRSIP